MNKKAYIIHIISSLAKSHPSLADEVSSLDEQDTYAIKKLTSHSYAQL
jgi:hypothetical protein